MRVPTRRAELHPKPKQDYAMTQVKFEELQAQLHKLIHVSRPPAIAEVQRLAQEGDFSENVPYQMAKGKLRGMNNRILELEHQIAHAEIITPPTDASLVQVGTTVTVRVNGEVKTYQVLGSKETNPGLGVISRTSPLGEALLGAKVGETVVVMVRNQPVLYEVLRIA